VRRARNACYHRAYSTWAAGRSGNPPDAKKQPGALSGDCPPARAELHPPVDCASLSRSTPPMAGWQSLHAVRPRDTPGCACCLRVGAAAWSSAKAAARAQEVPLANIDLGGFGSMAVSPDPDTETGAGASVRTDALRNTGCWSAGRPGGVGDAVSTILAVRNCAEARGPVTREPCWSVVNVTVTLRSRPARHRMARTPSDSDLGRASV